MSAMFTALHPEKVKNLILLAAPIDFATRDGLLNLWSRPECFDVDRFVDTYGNCPAEFLQASFLLLKPVQNLIEKPLLLFERAEDPDFVDDYLTMEMWINDNIPVPGEVYRQFVKYLYQQNLLVQNRMPVGRRVVNLRRINCPVLNIMAQADDLVPCAQSEPFGSLVGSRDRRLQGQGGDPGAGRPCRAGGGFQSPKGSLAARLSLAGRAKLTAGNLPGIAAAPTRDVPRSATP
jgi:polyhydroxyalkanoate synthase subunit PhaC